MLGDQRQNKRHLEHEITVAGYIQTVGGDRFKAESSVVPVSDSDALKYYSDNRQKYNWGCIAKLEALDGISLE